MNKMQIFNYREIPVRTILQNDEPWWVLADVCQVLSLGSPHKVANRLDLDEKGRNQIPTPGGNQEMTIINESGLYKVILRSDKPEAKKFTRWVTHEVLPAIRRTGAYAMAPAGPQAVQTRALTTDDYIAAARLTSDCRNERLPYVLGFLERGGFDIPRVESAAPVRPAPHTVAAVERTTYAVINLDDFL